LPDSLPKRDPAAYPMISSENLIFLARRSKLGRAAFNGLKEKHFRSDPGN
jgi:hypothetical protein